MIFLPRLKNVLKDLRGRPLGLLTTSNPIYNIVVLFTPSRCFLWLVFLYALMFTRHSTQFNQNCVALNVFLFFRIFFNLPNDDGFGLTKWNRQ